MDVINLEKAVRLMDGDVDLFCDLFDIIENSLPERFENVEKALKAESSSDLELYAHQFKGALRNVAADEACALLEKIEKAGARGDFALAQELFPQVGPVVERVLELYRSRTWLAAFSKT